MSGFSLANMFRPAQQVTPAPQQGQQPSQQMPPQQPGSSMQNGSMEPPQPGSSSQQQTSSPQADSPLDAWKDVWHTDPNAQAPTDPWSEPILPSDPNKIREAASKMDMLSNIQPELVQKVMAGNDPQSLIELINRVGQNTLAMAATLSSASVERAGTVIRDRTKQTLPDEFREYQLNNLPVNDAVLEHPGAQGLLKMTRQQLRMKNPNWSAQQINDEAVRYLKDFAGSVSKSSEPAQQRRDNTGTPEQDWESFLNS